MTRAFFWLERLIPALRYIQSLISWNSRSVIAATPVPATEGRWDGMESGRIEFARPEPDRLCGCSSIGNQTVAQGATVPPVPGAASRAPWAEGASRRADLAPGSAAGP